MSRSTVQNATAMPLAAQVGGHLAAAIEALRGADRASSASMTTASVTVRAATGAVALRQDR